MVDFNSVNFWYWAITAAMVVLYAVKICTKIRRSNVMYKKYKASLESEIRERQREDPDRGYAVTEFSWSKRVRALQTLLAEGGLTDINLTIAVDFSDANIWCGREIVGVGNDMHGFFPDRRNPYEIAMKASVDLLEPFLAGTKVTCYRLGSQSEGGGDVVPFLTAQCGDADGAATAYRCETERSLPSGQTTLAPIFHRVSKAAKATRKLQVLIVFLASEIDNLSETLEAAASAAHFPVSVIVVGVGDGKFSTATRLVDFSQKNFNFENISFINYGELLKSRAAVFADSAALDTLTPLLQALLEHRSLAANIGMFRQGIALPFKFESQKY